MSSSAIKKVQRVLFGEVVNMGGFPVRQPFPTQQIEQIDPFLLLHHHRGKINPGTSHKTAGVGPHPHRGFSPVTFVYEGSVHHRDSRGNDREVLAGGVQWMNAGMGIIHSERPGKSLAQHGGYQEIIQLWVNTPAAHKMDQPYYLAVDKPDMVSLSPHGGSGEILLVAGEQNRQHGPVKTPLPMLAVMGRLSAGASHQFDVQKNHSAMLYLLSGQLRLSGHGIVDKHQLVVFDRKEGQIEIQANDITKFLMVSGTPIGEPLQTYGPFVMNNQTQIMEAMRDYQMGKMGVLIEEFD